MEHISNQLQKLPENRVLAQQESKPLVIGDPEESFIVAVNDTKIKYSREEDIKEVLRLIMVKVGLRAANWPEDEEKSLLLSHIFSNYGGHTAKEILLAFEMGMAGKLENTEGEILDLTTYENFSCLYFSQVMNAYREWAKQIHRQVIKEEVPQIEYKEEMSETTYQDWYKSTAVDYASGKIKSMEFLPPMLADWLIGKGEIDHQQFLKRAAIIIGKKLAAESDNKEVYPDYVEFKKQYENAIKKNEPFTGKWALQIERLAKQIALNNYILQEQEL